MHSVEIPLSKRKLIFNVIGSLLFVIVGFAMIVRIANDQDRFNPLLLQGVGFLSVVFFGGIGIFILKKLFDTTPGLVINDRGIIDNSSGVSAGLIEWKDITGVSTYNVMTTKFLLIHVADPEKYLAKANKIKAGMMRANMKMTGTPISIPSTTLKYNFNELQKVVSDTFEQYKAHKSNS